MRSRQHLGVWSLTVLFVGACVGAAEARPPEEPAVLILLPGQPGLPAASAIASGIRAALLTEWSVRVSIEMEYVDVARFASPDVEERRLRTVYASKYGNQRFDVIVAALSEPFQFVLRARDELWPGTPIVVCGVDERTVGDLKPPPGFAILTIRFDMEGTVRAALALLPDTRHVVLVGGASPPERIFHDLIRQAVSRVRAVDLIDLTPLPIGNVLARVSNLPENTVIVQSSYQVDGAGRRFHGIDLVRPISNAANRPVFTPLGLALGLGVVGGSILEFEDIGRDAGRMATRLLRGEPAPATPVPSFATSLPRFDGRQLTRWRLDERRLPENSRILFGEPSLWQEYRWQAAIAVGLIAGQAALIAALLVQRRRRRETQALLAEQLRFEALVSEVGTACATATLDQLDERIRDGLRRVSTFLGVERGSLWQRPQYSSVLSITHLWQTHDAGAPPVIANLQSFPYFRERTEAGDIVCFASPDDLPPEASAEREACVEAGVRCAATIPLLGSDGPVGCLGFVGLRAERRWPAHIVQQLQRLAEPFSTAMIRLQTAAAVENSVALAGAVLAVLPGETAIIDSDGTIVQVNEAWATAARSGAEADAALKVGANYLDACRDAVDIPRDVAKSLHASIESILRGERDEFALEYPTSRCGEDRWLEVRVRGLAHFGGGAAVMHFDVTARRQAEAAAQRHLGQIAHLDRVAGMGELSSSLAHELNQPLTGILTNAQTAKRLLAVAEPDLDEVRECLVDIISDDQRASEMIRRMRRLLRKTDFVGMPLAINDVAANTIRLVANEAMLHAVTIDFFPAPDLPVVVGDIVQIQQVILNLLTNAITAAATGASSTRKVTVRTSSAPAPYVELAVRDSGNGIAETLLPRIFEPFFTTKPDGLGMGLAISRAIVEAHGGRLLAGNVPAGGAIFRVHLRTDQPGPHTTAGFPSHIGPRSE